MIPTGEGRFGDITFELGNSMLQVSGKAEDDRIAEADIADLGKNSLRPSVSYLKESAMIDLGAKIDTHRDHAVVT